MRTLRDGFECRFGRVHLQLRMHVLSELRSTIRRRVSELRRRIAGPAATRGCGECGGRACRVFTTLAEATRKTRRRGFEHRQWGYKLRPRRLRERGCCGRRELRRRLGSLCHALDITHQSRRLGLSWAGGSFAGRHFATHPSNRTRILRKVGRQKSLRGLFADSRHRGSLRHQSENLGPPEDVPPVTEWRPWRPHIRATHP